VFGPSLKSRSPVVLVVFDLLALGGSTVTDLPYERRRGILEGLGIPGPGDGADPGLGGR